MQLSLSSLPIPSPAAPADRNGLSAGPTGTEITSELPGDGFAEVLAGVGDAVASDVAKPAGGPSALAPAPVGLGGVSTTRSGVVLPLVAGGEAPADRPAVDPFATTMVCNRARDVILPMPPDTAQESDRGELPVEQIEQPDASVPRIEDMAAMMVSTLPAPPVETPSPSGGMSADPASEQATVETREFRRSEEPARGAIWSAAAGRDLPRNLRPMPAPLSAAVDRQPIGAGAAAADTAAAAESAAETAPMVNDGPDAPGIYGFAGHFQAALRSRMTLNTPRGESVVPPQGEGTEVHLPSAAGGSSGSAQWLKPLQASTGVASESLPLRAGEAGPNPNPVVITGADVAKIAAAMPEKTRALKPFSQAVAKSFVDGVHHSLTESAESLGISGADRTAMPPGSTSLRSLLPDAAVPPAVDASTVTRAEVTQLPASVSLPSSAHRAVEAVLEATDRFAAREQSTVNLQFSVGGNDLRVRVQLRDGEVQTTFRTDSPELRAALSAEWQGVNYSGGDRSLRLAAPVFAGGEQGSSLAGDTTSGQRGQQGHETAREHLAAAIPFRVADSSATEAGAAASPARVVSEKSIHLQTVA